MLHGLANARTALAAGVTTLRDLAADDVQFSLRRALDAGVVAGPRLVAHGMVGMTGGHADLFTPAAIVDRPPVADGPDECRRLVRHWARAGADGIKIATSGGVLSVGDRPAWRNHTRGGDRRDRRRGARARACGSPRTRTRRRASRSRSRRASTRSSTARCSPPRRPTASLPPASRSPRRCSSTNGSPPAAAHRPSRPRRRASWSSTATTRLRAAADAGVDLVLGTDANGFHVGLRGGVGGGRPDGGGARLVGRARAAGRDLPGRRRDRPAATSAASRPARRRTSCVVEGRPWEDLDALRPDRVVAVVSRGEVVAGSMPPALRS